MEPKSLGGFQIDREFILGRRLHRKVAGLLAFKYAIDVSRGAPRLRKRTLRLMRPTNNPGSNCYQQQGPPYRN